LRKSARAEESEKIPVGGAGIGVLDFDSSCTPSAVFDEDMVFDLFGKLHEDSSQLFKAVINDHARMVWNS
jgi:uncharacterized protein (TIGR04255 family)